MPNDEEEKDPTKYPQIRQGRPLTADDLDHRLSATDLLVGALEDFTVFEPNMAVVVYRGKCGCVIVRSSVPPLEAIGLLEVAKAQMIGSVLSHEDVDGEELTEEELEALLEEEGEGGEVN